MWSRSFRSSFVAINSAAPPLGHRMIGIVPAQPVRSSFDDPRWNILLTHRHAHTKQAANHAVNNPIQVFVTRFWTVDLVVCIVSKP